MFSSLFSFSLCSQYWEFGLTNMLRDIKICHKSFFIILIRCILSNAMVRFLRHSREKKKHNLNGSFKVTVAMLFYSFIRYDFGQSGIEIWFKLNRSLNLVVNSHIEHFHWTTSKSNKCFNKKQQTDALNRMLANIDRDWAAFIDTLELFVTALRRMSYRCEVWCDGWFPSEWDV